MPKQRERSDANLEPLPFVRKRGDDPVRDKNETEVANTSWNSSKVGNLSDSWGSGKFGENAGTSRKRRSRSKEKDERKRSKNRSRSRNRSRTISNDRKRRSYSKEKRKRSRTRSSERKKSRKSGSPLLSVRTDTIKSEVPIPQDLKLPPAIRSAVVAQSVLAKPEALPAVIEQAAAEATRLGLPVPVTSIVPYSNTSEEKKRKKSRWSTTKSFVPGMPTILPPDLSEDQRQSYLLRLEIEDYTRRLRYGDFMFDEDTTDRSPSPEPVYDINGKRLNSRDILKRNKIELLRHDKIQQLIKLDTTYKPPGDYRPPNVKLSDRVWIPQDDHPNINFVGLIIGPRGNTLKTLEAETGAKIIIRGRGSIKEGIYSRLAITQGPMMLPGADEPLHAYITGPDPIVIQKAVARVRQMVDDAINPGAHSRMRQLQLRELALINGTLRPEDMAFGIFCSNCGSDQHKTWECADTPNITANTICHLCGNAGHIAKDCKTPNPKWDGGIDEEYSALMQELGEKSIERIPYTGGLSAVTPAPKGSLLQPPKQVPVYRMPSGAPVIRQSTGHLSKSGPMWPPGPDGIGFMAPPPPPPPGFVEWLASLPPEMRPPGWQPGVPLPMTPLMNNQFPPLLPPPMLVQNYPNTDVSIVQNEPDPSLAQQPNYDQVPPPSQSPNKSE